LLKYLLKKTSGISGIKKSQADLPIALVTASQTACGRLSPSNREGRMMCAVFFPLGVEIKLQIIVIPSGDAGYFRIAYLPLRGCKIPVNQSIHPPKTT